MSYASKQQHWKKMTEQITGIEELPPHLRHGFLTRARTAEFEQADTEEVLRFWREGGLQDLDDDFFDSLLPQIREVLQYK